MPAQIITVPLSEPKVIESFFLTKNKLSRYQWPSAYSKMHLKYVWNSFLTLFSNSHTVPMCKVTKYLYKCVYIIHAFPTLFY